MDYSQDLNKAVETLRNGGIILYPTDTVWGIGCDATNSTAVKKIYSLKQRPSSKSMLVLVDSAENLKKLAETVPDEAVRLIESTEKPLTIIYKVSAPIAPDLLADDGTLGIRVTREKFSKELCRLLGRPVVSTSANVTSEPTPALFSEISEEIKKGVDYIVKYRQDDRTSASPSNIIKIDDKGGITVIR